jgi:hypothetical protein
VLRILAVLAVLILVPAAPAAAHGGKIKLEVAGDGATGVTVRALYENDSHPVEDKVLRLTLTATGEGGKTVGPLDVTPAAEGRSFYTSPGVLTPGRWTVVVTSTDTSVLRAESTVEARAPQAAPAQTTSAPTPTASPVAGSGSSGKGKGNSNGTVWTVAFALALALTGIAVFLIRRRGTPGAAATTRQPSGRSGGRPAARASGRPRRHN